MMMKYTDLAVTPIAMQNNLPDDDYRGIVETPLGA